MTILVSVLVVVTGLLVFAVISKFKKPTNKRTKAKSASAPVVPKQKWHKRVPWGWLIGIVIAPATIWLALHVYNQSVDSRARAEQAQAAERTAAANLLAGELEHPLFVVGDDSSSCLDSTFYISLSASWSNFIVLPPKSYRAEYFWPTGSTLPFAVHIEGSGDTEYWPGNPPRDTPPGGLIKLRALGGRTGSIKIHIFPLGKMCKKTALSRAPSTVEIQKTAPPVQLYGRFFFCRFLHND